MFKTGAKRILHEFSLIFTLPGGIFEQIGALHGIDGNIRNTKGTCHKAGHHCKISIVFNLDFMGYRALYCSPITVTWSEYLQSIVGRLNPVHTSRPDQLIYMLVGTRCADCQTFFLLSDYFMGKDMGYRM